MPSSACKKSALDRKSTRLNSSHTIISYAVFCLKKKMCSRSEEHTSELQSHDNLVCRLLLAEKHTDGSPARAPVGVTSAPDEWVQVDLVPVDQAPLFFLMIGRPPTVHEQLTADPVL